MCGRHNAVCVTMHVTRLHARLCPCRQLSRPLFRADEPRFSFPPPLPHVYTHTFTGADVDLTLIDLPGIIQSDQTDETNVELVSASASGGGAVKGLHERGGA
jgi:hypothetical protein